MNRTPELILAAAVILSFGAGVLAEKTARKPDRIRVDARPGVEFEVKPAQGLEPKTIMCRISDGKADYGSTP